MSDRMTKSERDQLISVARRRAKQAALEAEMRAKILLAEVQDQLTAEFDAHDRLWADAVMVAEEAAAKANAQIQAVCADIGIPPKDAPRLGLGWASRSNDYSNSKRRNELRKLAEARVAALTQTAKTAINAALLDTEERLLVGGLESAEAKAFLEQMPRVEGLMPNLGIEDLGVARWQPPEDAASQLTTPLTASGRKRRRILRAIEAHPEASDRKIAQIVGCDHKTVATYRRKSGDFPAIPAEFPASAEEFPASTGAAGD